MVCGHRTRAYMGCQCRYGVSTYISPTEAVVHSKSSSYKMQDRYRGESETYANHTCDNCQPYVRQLSTIRATIANHTCGICQQLCRRSLHRSIKAIFTPHWIVKAIHTDI